MFDSCLKNLLDSLEKECIVLLVEDLEQKDRGTGVAEDGPEKAEMIVEKPLTTRQAAFVHEYLTDLNGAQAAIRAGYNPESAHVRASQLLAVRNVRIAVEKAKAQRASRVNVTADGVLHEMSLLANSSLEHYYIDEDGHVKPTPDAPDGAMRAISSIKQRKTVHENAATGDITIHYDTEIRLWDKPTPLKLMGRHVGLFPNRVEVTGKGGAPIELTAMTNEQLATQARELAQLAEKLKDE